MFSVIKTLPLTDLKMKFILLCILLIRPMESFSTNSENYNCPKCEDKGCHPVKANKLNIHLVPHTHDDAGWLKTVDQYYYGAQQRHAPFGVQYIIDSVLAELDANKNRRFIYAETSFLWRWWYDRGDYHREKFKKLVKENRLQLVHGGWVMSDEATPHYTALIHQMSFGLKFLDEILDKCSRPSIAWQIDSFGHSSEVGLQFADMDYNAVFFGRIDREDLMERMENRRMEMIWRPDNKLDVKGDLFTGILYNLYMPPDGFCFDVFCNDEPIMDGANLHGNNVESRISTFVYYAKNWANSYQTNNLLITMGGDFNYMVASSWFVNIDKLIKYGNAMYKDINLIYSTPECYLQSISKTNLTWPVKENDDFFPYSSYEGKFWTGYFTSRPTLKYFAHRVNNLLTVANSLATFWGNGLVDNSLFLLKRVVALLQHHDAISGTEKQHVANDYSLYLHEAVFAGEDIFTASFRQYFGSQYRHQHFCMKANISECKVTEERRMFIVHIYNPLGQAIDYVVRVPVQMGQYSVIGHQGIVDYELIPLPRQVIMVPGRKSSAIRDLYFIAKDLPPLGLTSYFVKREMLINTTRTPPHHLLQQTNSDVASTDNEALVVDNFGLCQLIFNSTTGLLNSLVLNQTTLRFEQNFYYYAGTRDYHYKASGAYTFGPYQEIPIEISKKVSLNVYKGHEIIEIHQTFNQWVSQVISMKKGDCSIEFTWLVGPISTSGQISKEIITRYTTDIKSLGKFWTDSNGRRFIERIRNWRPFWKHTQNHPISANFYPITSAARIKDDSSCLTILTDRAQAGSSLHDGQLEIMVHRRVLTDDGKGVLEPLNEESYGQGLVARGTHTVQFINSKNGCQNEAVIKHRKTAITISSGPWISISSANISLDYDTAPKKINFLINTLPENIHILSLERLSNNTILIRLEHFFESEEHSILSAPVTINLADLFRNIYIQKVDEMTLDGSKYKYCSNRMKWNYSGRDSRETIHMESQGKSFPINLEPMQIKTLLLTVTQY